MNTRSFACVAEAVAFFHKLGFDTVEPAIADNRRHMENAAGDHVTIEHRSLLHAVATEFPATPWGQS